MNKEYQSRDDKICFVTEACNYSAREKSDPWFIGDRQLIHIVYLVSEMRETETHILCEKYCCL